MNEEPPPSSRASPLAFFHDPTFLPNQPPSALSAVLLSPFPIPFPSFPPSLSARRVRRAASFSRRSYLAIFETQPRVLCDYVFVFARLYRLFHNVRANVEGALMLITSGMDGFRECAGKLRWEYFPSAREGDEEFLSRALIIYSTVFRPR